MAHPPCGGREFSGIGEYLTEFLRAMVVMNVTYSENGRPAENMRKMILT
jgi:hypothetical protein